MNILDLNPEQFQSALRELAQQGVNTDELMRQYERKNSLLSGIYGWADQRAADAAEAGRQPLAMGLLSKEAGTTGMDALRSVDVEPMNFIAGLLADSASAIDAPASAARGLLPAGDMAGRALGTAGFAQVGGAASMGKGVLDYDPTTARSFSDYLSKVNPKGVRVAAEDRPNLMMGDMYGMLPRGARKVGSRDDVTFYRGPDGDYYATAYNPDVGEQDVVGYIMPRGDMTELAVVDEMKGKGIGSELQYLMRSQDPYAPTGGLTEAGEATLRKTYGRLANEGIVPANRSTTAGAIALPAARNEAERMARDILEMRAAGRASEVTDEMMAQADPQYMFANTPLPMDEASRMMRAIGQGYDLTRPMYHGTDVDFSSVNTDLGTGERYRTGFFSSDNPDVAASYAPNRDKGQILPVMSRAADKGVVIDAQGANWNRIDAASPARYSNSALANEFPELVADENAYTYFPEMYDDLMGLRELSTNAMARQRRFVGDPSITFENVIDRGPYSLTNEQALSASRPSTVAVDFDPANVRSRFARFDPEFSHLANLNAANASPLAGLLALQSEEDRNRALRTLLGGF